MMNNNNVLRQITDIQVQCERIVAAHDMLGQYKDLQKYSKEICNYLLLNVTDDFIVKHIHSIPELNLNKADGESGMDNILILIVVLLSFGTSAAYFRSRRDKEKMENQIREMRNKYASLEFLLKNHF